MSLIRERTSARNRTSDDDRVLREAAAVRDGLVAKLGQDRVQEIMAAAFAAVRDDLPKFEDIEAEPTFADDAWSAHTPGRAAAATVESRVYCLRDGIGK